MKKQVPSPLYNSDNVQTSQNNETSGPPKPNITPYLRTVLSEVPSKGDAKKDFSLLNPDRLAALRYIKESALLHKFYFGKMSC